MRRNQGKFVVAALVGLFIGCCGLGCGPTELTGGGTVITVCRPSGNVDGGVVGSCGSLRPICFNAPDGQGNLPGVCCGVNETNRQCLTSLVSRGQVTPPGDHNWSRSCSTSSDCTHLGSEAICFNTVCSRPCASDGDCGTGICIPDTENGGNACVHRCTGNPSSPLAATSCGVIPSTPTAVILVCVPFPSDSDGGTARHGCVPILTATP